LQEGDIVRFRFASGAEAEGCLRLPDGPGPHPAVLLLHDHGGAFALGWRKLFDLPESREGLARHYGGTAPAEVILSRGFAVLSVDAFGWGGRQAGGYEGQQALAANAMQLGWSLAGIVAAEDVAAARWLAGRPEVDPGRVGAFGFSFGGYRAWQVAALSRHVAAAASVGWMARRTGLMGQGAPLLRGQSAFYMLHPGVAGVADFPDLAGLAAPKPLFLRSGRDDPHMPEGAVAGAWDDLRRIWEAAGGEGPDCAFRPGGHTCGAETQSEAADFLLAALTG
jgi:dienelactone hydrolase